jgi:quercetin dioxygenase-like cupin family protein
MIISPSACTYAGHCERICPTQAINRRFQIVCLPKEKKLMQTVFVPNWRDQAVFSPDGPQPQVLVQTDKLKAIIGSLEAGQVIPPHPEALAVYHFLEGSGWMTVDDERYPVLSGTIIITPEGAARGVEADTRLVFLAARIA